MQARVLIVDDNEGVFDSLKPNFYQFGLEAIYAANGAAAEAAVEQQGVAAVLLDIMLGTESGIDVLKRLKEINQRVPVIMVTG